jgi:hypothetical protein
MGAGMSDAELRAAQRRRLKSVLGELRLAGVSCSLVSGQHPPCEVEGRNFSVHFGPTSRASNGEVYAPLIVFIDGAVFGNNFDSEVGLSLIKARHGHIARSGSYMVDEIESTARAAALVARIAEALRSKAPNDALFLHGRDGGLMPTIPVGGMVYGQIYAYPEVRDGRPFVRIGPGNQYAELEPGWSVRRSDGSVVAQVPVE